MITRAHGIAAAVGLVLAVCIWGTLKWYGSARDAEGYDRAMSEVKIETARVAQSWRDRERQLQVESDERYAQAQILIRAQQGELDSLASNSDRLREQIADLAARAAETAERTGSSVATATGSWDVLAQCQRRYAEVVRDFESLAADFLIAQSWAKVIDPDGARRHITSN